MENELNLESNKNYSTEKVTANTEDYIVKCIGAFGLWQLGVFGVACLTRFVSMWNMLSIVFLTPDTNFRCIEFKNNITVDIENTTCYDNCEQYEFHKDVFDDTLISEYELICDRAWMASLTLSILMFGLLVGVFLFGWISDRYGRRKSLLSSAFTDVFFMLIVPFSPCYWAFVSLQFLVGIASGGTLAIGVVYIIELVGPQYRETAGALAILPDGFAEALLSLFAYYSSNWRIYSLEYAIVSLIFAILMTIIPESPRWLVSKGRVDEAVDILIKIAKFNKRDSSQVELHVKEAVKGVTEDVLSEPSYLVLLRFKFNLIAVTIIWISAGACYFGINQYVTFLGNDLLISVALLGLSQVLICPLGIVLNKLLGRKKSCILCLLITGASMITLVFLPEGHWTCRYLGIMGFAACSGLFNVIYIYTGELFPTSTRSLAYGAATSGAKLGSMIVPFVVTLNPHWLPSMIFVAMVLISLLFCVFLPETRGKKLQDNA